MRTRRNSVGLWLSDAELTHLRQQCQITGLNTNTYLRNLSWANISARAHLTLTQHFCVSCPPSATTSTRSRTGQTEKAMRRKQKSTKRPAL